MAIARRLAVSVSRDHETHAELFRNRPELARVLLRMCAGIDLPDGTAELTTIDASQVLPVEARCDVVVVFRGPDGAALAAVIVEIQKQPDLDKRRTWPLYVTALRARLGCPAILLVFAPSPPIARWARQPISIGHPGMSLTPIVISYDDLPRITDDAAGLVPEVAVLSARAHPDLETIQVAANAIYKLPTDLRTLYWNFLTPILPDLVRQALEPDMTPERMKEVIAEYQAEVVRQDTLYAVARKLAKVKLGARFDAELEWRIGYMPPANIDELVDALICTDDPEEMIAAIKRIAVPR